MAGGRPLKFQNVEELEQKVAAYFAECKEESRPLTITGLALALDTTRETLLDYEDKAEYSDTIKRAKLKIHSWTEEYLFTGKNQTGAIFNLKNNYGWKEQSENKTTLIMPKPLLDNVHSNDSIEEIIGTEEEA